MQRLTVVRFHQIFTSFHQQPSMSTGQEDDSDWTVACSDEETCSKTWTVREVAGKRVWEPTSGKQIAFLYQQLEKTGCMDLRWQCPGRRSPSVHSASQGTGDKKAANASEASSKAPVVTEFDFDEEFADTNAATVKVAAIPNRRKTGNQTSELFSQLFSFSPLFMLLHVVTCSSHSPILFQAQRKWQNWIKS